MARSLSCNISMIRATTMSCPVVDGQARWLSGMGLTAPCALIAVVPFGTAAPALSSALPGENNRSAARGSAAIMIAALDPALATLRPGSRTGAGHSGCSFS